MDCKCISHQNGSGVKRKGIQCDSTSKTYPGLLYHIQPAVFAGHSWESTASDIPNEILNSVLPASWKTKGYPLVQVENLFNASVFPCLHFSMANLTRSRPLPLLVEDSFTCGPTIVRHAWSVWIWNGRKTEVKSREEAQQLLVPVNPKLWSLSPFYFR